MDDYLNLWKKVPGKKFLEKNLEIKYLEKSPNFSSPWKKVTGNKVLCFGILGLFFPKIVWGLPIKSQEMRFQEKSPWENKSEEKKKS